LGNVIGTSETILNLLVRINDAWQDPLAVMKAIAAFEQNSIIIGHTLFSIVGKSLEPIGDPHCGFTVDTAQRPNIGGPSDLAVRTLI
jgi:hypothetical protein